MFTCHTVCEKIRFTTAVRLLVWYYICLSGFAIVAYSTAFQVLATVKSFRFEICFIFSVISLFFFFLIWYFRQTDNCFTGYRFISIVLTMSWVYAVGFSSNICHTVVGLSFWHFTHFCLSVRQMANGNIHIDN